MPDHPKIKRLKRRLGSFGDYAVEAVVRLWGHCQSSQRGQTWPQADSEYVEIVAGWRGNPGELFAALVEVGIIEQGPGAKAVIIHDWDAFNSKAKANWENGRLGGKPTANPTLTQDKAQLLLGKPKRNPKSVMGNPNPISGNLIVSESVSQSGTSDLNKNGSHPSLEGKGPSAAAVNASRTRFAALTARKQELSRRGEDLDDEERGELAKINRDLSELTEAQRAGNF